MQIIYMEGQCDAINDGFKWLSKEEIKKFNIYSVEENCKIGSILEVDLE